MWFEFLSKKKKKKKSVIWIKWNHALIFYALFYYSIMEEQTSAGLLGVLLLQLVMIMMLQLMNMVSAQEQ